VNIFSLRERGAIGVVLIVSKSGNIIARSKPLLSIPFIKIYETTDD